MSRLKLKVSMKKYVFLLSAAAALGILSAKAQDEDTMKVKRKVPKEIIIREDGSKDKKTVIVIEDGKVTIDGKPASDWEGGKVTIMPDGDGVYQLKRRLDDDQVVQFKMLQDRFDGFNQVRLGVYSANNEKGAEVTKVEDSSAAFKAGLKAGDIINKVNESPISDPEILSKVIRDHQAGDVVTVHYLRGDKEEETKVTLEKPKEFEFKKLTLRMDRPFGWSPRPRLGANIQDMEDNTGVKVLRVNPESPAAKAGLQKDDVITSIDGKKVTNVDDAMDALQDEEKTEYPVTVNRGGNTVTLQVKIPKDLKSGTL